MKSFSLYSVFLLCSFLLLLNNNNKCVCVGLSFHEDGGVSGGSTGTVGRLVKKEDRLPVVATEFGQISAVDVDDGSSETGKRRGRHYNNYHVQFITLEPNSLFLPVLLHADMVFYVQTGLFLYAVFYSPDFHFYILIWYSINLIFIYLNLLYY